MIEITREVKEARTLELLKTAPIIQLFSFIDLLAERCSLDSEYLKKNISDMCDELIEKEQAKRWKDVIDNGIALKLPPSDPFYHP